MASPVDTSVKHFTSAMLAAPALSGTVGALINVLDACLVTGFDIKSATSLVVASGVATLSFTGTHSAAVDSVILVDNASIGALNGEQRVTAVAAGVVSFATAAANGTATGAVTFKMAPAGWAKVFTGTNLAAYKATAVEGTGCFLRVDDTGTTTARVRGFESMTDVNTGVNGFPTQAQFSNGLWLSKSNAASADVRPWQIFASERSFYYCPRPLNASGEHQANFFGDINSLKSNDPYSCALRANITDKSANAGPFADDVSWGDYIGGGQGLFLARAANAVGSAVAQTSAMPAIFGSNQSALAYGTAGMPYPSATDNGLLLAPLMVYGVQGLRGKLPGVFSSPQIVNSSFASGDRVAGTGNLAGKSVRIVETFQANVPASQGILFFDGLSEWY